MKVSKKSKNIKPNKEVLEVEKKDIIEEKDAIKEDKSKTEDIKLEKTEIKKVENKRLPKSVCKVLLAKPSYFIISKNGEKIIVNKKNSYHRGEEILY